MQKKHAENIFIALLFMRFNLLKRQVVNAESFMNRTMLLGPKACISQSYDRDWLVGQSLHWKRPWGN